MNQKIKKYAALSVSILSGTLAKSDVIYTDIMPDDTVFFNDSFELDLNNDLTTDYLFWLNNFTSTGGMKRSSAGIKPYNQNELLFSYSFFNVRAMQPADIIDSFYNGWSQFPKSNNLGAFYYSAYGSVWNTGPLFKDCGLVDNYCISENSYLPLRLKGLIDYYYGWVRVSRLDTQGLIIHDYAYNDCLNNYIYTGSNTSINCDACEPIVVENIITDCDTVFYNGNWYTTNQEFHNVSKSTTNGCDTIVIDKIRIGADKFFNNGTIYACEEFNHNGTIITSNQYIYDTLNTSVGCDSIVQSFISINQNYYLDYNRQDCDSAYFFNEWHYESGIYYDTALNGVVCTTFYSTILTITPSINDTINVNLFDNQSIELNGITYNEDAEVTFYHYSQDYCDSNVTYIIRFSGVGVESNVRGAVKFWPNPVIDELHFNSGKVKKVEIFDLEGGLPKSISELKQNNFSIDFSEIEKGVYFLKITDNEGKVHFDKVIKN